VFEFVEEPFHGAPSEAARKSRSEPDGHQPKAHHATSVATKAELPTTQNPSNQAAPLPPFSI